MTALERPGEIRDLQVERFLREQDK